MNGQTTSIYGLTTQSRALIANTSNTESHQFYLGSCSVRESNELHLVQYNEDTSEIERIAVYNHPSQIFSIASCPWNASRIITTHCKPNQSYIATLWHTAEASSSLSSLITFDGHDGLCSAIFNPYIDGSHSCLTFSSSSVKMWSLDMGCSTLTSNEENTLSDLSNIQAVCWDPHHSSSLIVASSNFISSLDIRSHTISQTINTPESQFIQDVDYNPNKPFHIVTGGRDRLIRFWDLRKPDIPLLILSQHSHWVCKAKFNRFHDQLLLSSGSDSQVNLWSITSASSAPATEFTSSSNPNEDRIIHAFDDHEDSVYSIAWSCCDAWIFASLSYNGRMVVNNVPPEEKYKILL